MTYNESLLKNIKASMKIEGFDITREDETLIKDYLDNKITLEDGLNKIKNEFKVIE